MYRRVPRSAVRANAPSSGRASSVHPRGFQCTNRFAYSLPGSALGRPCSKRADSYLRDGRKAEVSGRSASAMEAQHVDRDGTALRVSC